LTRTYSMRVSKTALMSYAKALFPATSGPAILILLVLFDESEHGFHTACIAPVPCRRSSLRVCLNFF
jgi:hypothetical protein